MGKTRLLLVGAGGHARAVAEAAELSGEFVIVGFVDEAICTDVMLLGYPVLGPLGNISKHREAYD